MTFQGKTVVITGASMGIGEAIAQEFLLHGANVVLSSRDLDRAEAARTRLGAPDRTLAVACDVRDRKQLDALSQAAIERFGRIDVWVNNAGHGLLDAVADMDIAACRSMFDTNLFGAIEGMQVAAAAMKQQKDGVIINITSVAGHIAVPYMASYCATKFALNAIGKAARIELKPHGVHVLTVCPGYINTDFGKNAIKGAQPLRLSEAVRRGIKPDRVARAVVSACHKRKREIVVPVKNRINIFFYQRFPSLVEWVMENFMLPRVKV